MRDCRLNLIISMLVVLSCCNGTNAFYTSDDDVFNVLFGRFPTPSPSIADTMPPTSIPSKSPTKSPTLGRSRLIETGIPSYSPTGIPSYSPTRIPSYSPTRDTTTTNPTTMMVHNKITERPSTAPSNVRMTPVPTELKSKTNQPTTPKTSSSPTSSGSLCSANNGSFGIVTSERRIVQYYYRVEYILESDITEILTDIERSILGIILNETSIFPKCYKSLVSIEGNGLQENKIVGMSSAPTDRVLSFCDNACTIVEGRMTMYISSTQSRRKLSVVDDGMNEILVTLKDSMSDGDLNSANSNIIRVAYVDPDDKSIYTINPELEGKGDEKSDVPVQRSIPAYGYALVATSATLVVLAAVIAIRSRRRQNYTEEEKENDDDEDPISLQDDGSTGCVDASTLTTDRIFMVWKNMNR